MREEVAKEELVELETGGELSLNVPHSLLELAENRGLSEVMVP